MYMINCIAILRAVSIFYREFFLKPHFANFAKPWLISFYWDLKPKM